MDEGASWLERLTDWLAPTVHAVVRGLAYGSAAYLDASGLLAISSATEHLSLDRQELEMGEHLPVWAVNVESGEQVWQTHLGGVVGLAQTPDGEHLLVHSSSRIFRLDAVRDDEGHALYLIAAATGDVESKLYLPGRPYSGTESMLLAGGHVYIRANTVDGPEVIVVDPDDLSVIGRWQQDDGSHRVYALLPLP